MDASGQIDVVADVTPEIFKIVSLAQDGSETKVHHKISIENLSDVKESPAPYALMIFTTAQENYIPNM